MANVPNPLTLNSLATAPVFNGRTDPNYNPLLHADYQGPPSPAFHAAGPVKPPSQSTASTSQTNPNTQSSSLGVQTPSYTVGVNDPATLAAYQQAIGNYQTAIGQLPTQLQGSEDQIQSSYQNALHQLQGQANQAKSNYGTSTTQNQQGYVTNKNAIAQNAGASLNGLLRLLGARGAGGSSAALISAPQAVATQATAQRSGAGQTYGQNQSNLDTAYQTYLTGNQNDLFGIASQRDQALNSAKAQEAQQRAGLLQQLATLSAQQAAATGANPATAAQPFLDQANQFLASANQLGLNTFTPKYNTAAFQAPSAASYTASQFASPQTGGQQPSNVANTVISPAFAQLLKPKLSGVSA